MNKPIENKVKHTCLNCLFRDPDNCFFFSKHFKKQPVNVENKCPQWLSKPESE